MKSNRAVRAALSFIIALALSACGGGDRDVAITAEAATPGATPFIAMVNLVGESLNQLGEVQFTITPKPGTVSKPVSVTYTADYLRRRGYAGAIPTKITVPVFGLYAGFDNTVALSIRYLDGRRSRLSVRIATASWADPQAVYDHVKVNQARGSAALGFDFFYMKSAYGPPVVIDTDAQVRWVGPAIPQVGTGAVDYSNGGFVMGAFNADIYRVDLAGTYAVTGSLTSSGVTTFAHDLQPGKVGFLGNVDAYINGVFQYESTIQEFTVDGRTLAVWDLAKSLADVMRAGGDDPALFVRPGLDWFHTNTAIYVPEDNSLIVSSRENFVVKLDYDSGAVRWILGDPSKYWYTFPSLRAKALTWVGGGLVPIGQHATSIAPDGSLMLFNNGYASANQPVGAPIGETRAYSVVSDYIIDETAKTVREAWHYDANKQISSIVCSSARAVKDGSILIDYAVAENLTATRIVGLEPSRKVVFDFRFPNSGCSTAWNAQPLALEAMRIE